MSITASIVKTTNGTLLARNSARYPKMNNARTCNSYGDFNWAMKRRKGIPVAVISRKGKRYGNLALTPGFGYHNGQGEIVEYIEHVLMMEV